MANTLRTAICSSAPAAPRACRSRSRLSPAFATLAVLATGSVLEPAPAHAFSQITREDGRLLGRDDIISAPLPPLDPDRSGNAPDWGLGPSILAPQLPEAPVEEVEDSEPLTIRYGDEDLPVPVRDLRARLMEIAASGDIEALRPYIERGARETALSVVPFEEDPIEFLRSASGDGEGVEILAILLDVLRAGHVRMDAGQDSEIFVWPYFAQTSIEDLTRPQLVELFQIVTAGDYQQMLELGAYYFYRVGISPDGRLEFFLAGD